METTQSHFESKWTFLVVWKWNQRTRPFLWFHQIEMFWFWRSWSAFSPKGCDCIKLSTSIQWKVSNGKYRWCRSRKRSRDISDWDLYKKHVYWTYSNSLMAPRSAPRKSSSEIVVVSKFNTLLNRFTPPCAHWITSAELNCPVNCSLVIHLATSRATSRKIDEFVFKSVRYAERPGTSKLSRMNRS